MRRIVFWISLALIFVTPWENVVLIGSLGTISRSVGIFLALCWFATALVTGRFRNPHFFHGVVFLFALWNAASIFWSVDSGATIQRALTYFQLGGMVFILWDVYGTPADLRAGLQAYVLGAYVAMGSLLYNYGLNLQQAYNRFSAIGFDPNDLAFILALGMPAAFYLAVSETDSRQSRLFRLINYGYVPVAIYCILLTASRSAFVTIFPVLLFISRSLNRVALYRRILLLGTIIGGLLVVVSFSPQLSFQRLGTITTRSTEGTLYSRTAVWSEGIAIFETHPILGVGSGAFRAAAVKTGHVAHNIFVALLAEVGIIGFVLFVTILMIVIYHALRQPKSLSRLWLTILVIWFIGASFQNLEYRKQTWLFFSFIIISSSLYTRREATPSSATVPYPSGRLAITR